MTTLHRSSVLMLVVTILALLPFGQSVLYPTPANRTIDSPTLARRECKPRPSSPGNFDCDFVMPSLSEIKSHMLDPAMGSVTAEKSVWFYSNLGVVDEVIPWAIRWLWHQKIMLFYSAQDALKTMNWYHAQLEWIQKHPDKMQFNGDVLEEFNICWVEALAAAALHPNAYFFTNEDKEPMIQSYWVQVEFPALTLNENVKKIYRIDPRPPQERGQDPKTCEEPKAELIWDRARGDKVITKRRMCRRR